MIKAADVCMNRCRKFQSSKDMADEEATVLLSPFDRKDEVQYETEDLSRGFLGRAGNAAVS